MMFTIHFDGQFWVGVLESHEGDGVRAIRVVFGAEPTDAELHDWLLKHGAALLERLERAAAIPAGRTAPARRVNPKRALREAARAAREPRASTAARLGLALMVDKAPDCTVIARAQHGQDALETLRRLAAEAKPLPQVVLMDIRMPVMNGIDATAAITREFPQVRVLALTTYDEDDHAFAMLGAGAAGFLLKDVRTPQLHDALRAIAQGDAILTPRITRELLTRSITATSTPTQSAASARLKDLSPRERSVAQLVASGLNNQEIAAQLHLQPDSVKKTVTRILAKLGLRDRVQITIAVRDNPLMGS